MADKTGIEWTDATWNPTVGCTIVSPGCTNCYAMKQAYRVKKMQEAQGIVPSTYHGTTKVVKGLPVWTGHVARAPEATLTQPLRWAKPKKIFVNSMSDLFHESVPDEWIDQVFAIMALAPQHTFQILTKRSKRMREYMSRNAEAAINRVWQEEYNLNVDRLETGKKTSSWDLPDSNLGTWVKTTCHPDCQPPCKIVHDADSKSHRADKYDGKAFGGGQCYGGGYTHYPVTWPLPNVWIGVSAEDQTRADERIPDLLATPAAIRFVSAEPLLGPIDFKRLRISINHHTMVDALNGYALENGGRTKISWIIAGGESGPGARPMHPDWLRSIRDQCKAAGTAFLFKQWGEWAPGENCGDGPTKTERTATFWDEEWHFSSLTPHMSRETHADDEPDLFYIGKKRAGRMLDGVLHDDYPQVRA